MQKDYERYFDALNKHPRLLVGTEVPSMTKEGMEVLRDSADAKEWQEAVRHVLAEQIREDAQQRMQGATGFLETMHEAVALFQNNPDLIPGTKGFNRDLADRFAAMAQPYEVRVDGKLQGYSIPVQPIIDNLRKQSQPPAAAAATPAPTPQPDPPQAGIASKAGSSTEKEDFSTLFGTIGLPNMVI